MNSITPETLELFRLAFFFGGLACMWLGAEFAAFFERQPDVPDGKITGDTGLR